MAGAGKWILINVGTLRRDDLATEGMTPRFQMRMPGGKYLFEMKAKGVLLDFCAD